LAEVFEEAGARLILVDFFAPWCAPCKKIAPILERLANKHRPRPGDGSSGVLFCKVDVDKSRELAQVAIPHP
jgi:thiol-disulfide isomerase/thioredoxin